MTASDRREIATCFQWMDQILSGVVKTGGLSQALQLAQLRLKRRQLALMYEEENNIGEDRDCVLACLDGQI